jgi:bifunctional enzyme CysN/CysC
VPRAPTSPLPGPETQTDLVRIVIAGHVDHGKSTLVGRLLADVDALPAGRLESVRALCERAGRPFEYAFLLDALQDERSQGVCPGRGCDSGSMCPPAPSCPMPTGSHSPG